MERSIASIISSALEKSAEFMAKIEKTHIGAKKLPAELQKK